MAWTDKDWMYDALCNLDAHLDADKNYYIRVQENFRYIFENDFEFDVMIRGMEKCKRLVEEEKLRLSKELNSNEIE